MSFCEHKRILYVARVERGTFVNITSKSSALETFPALSQYFAAFPFKNLSCPSNNRASSID